MRTVQRITLRLFVVAFAIAISTSPAWTQRLDLQKPEDRMEDWRNGLQRFVERNPDLTQDQLLALQNLADIAERDFFATSLHPKKRALIADRLGELGSVLSYKSYLKLVRSFGDLRLWLVANGLATQVEVALPDCNCTYGHHCQSGTCNDVACEPKGTTHTGVCKAVSQDQLPF